MARLGGWRWWIPDTAGPSDARGRQQEDRERACEVGALYLYPEVERACVDVLAVWLGGSTCRGR